MELESEQQEMDRPQEMSWYQMAKVWRVLGSFNLSLSRSLFFLSFPLPWFCPHQFALF